MDIKKVRASCVAWLRKNKYMAIALMLGILLMIYPSVSGTESENDTVTTETAAPVAVQIRETLEETLSEIYGVGKVRVMLTYAIGVETVYQQDEDTTDSDSGHSMQEETIILTGTDRGEQALIRYQKAPVYLGAVIVCQGADQPAVKLAVMDAVSKATGLSSDKIAIVKMK